MQPATASSHEFDVANLDPDECNLLVAGLTRDVDDATLKRMFEPFGNVKSAIVMLKANTAVSRGFGFVLFESEEEGSKAQEVMDGAPCGPNTLNIRRSRHDGRVVETNAVFVRNVPLTASASDVHMKFSCAGDVLGVTLSNANNGRTIDPKRYKFPHAQSATVEFGSIEQARRAIDVCHNVQFYDGPPLIIDGDEFPRMLVKFAEGALD